MAATTPTVTGPRRDAAATTADARDVGLVLGALTLARRATVDDGAHA